MATWRSSSILAVSAVQHSTLTQLKDRRYLVMGTLSLFFFNLLPLPYLDGSQFLDTILQVLNEDELDGAVYDIEALEDARDRRNPRERERWKRMLMAVVPQATIGLFGICIILGVINVLW
jgi:S2P endopeptidase